MFGLCVRTTHLPWEALRVTGGTRPVVMLPPMSTGGQLVTNCSHTTKRVYLTVAARIG